MPQAVVAAAVATGATYIGATIAGVTLAAGVLTATFVTTLVLSGVSMIMAKKGRLSTLQGLTGRSQMIKQPVTSHKIIYGRQKVKQAPNQDISTLLLR